MIFGSLGDTINNYNINTENTPDGTLGYPYDSSTIIITTADQYINHQVRKALINAGFSSDIMNNDNIPKDLVNMGLERGKDTFVILMRASIWESKEIGQEYEAIDLKTNLWVMESFEAIMMDVNVLGESRDALYLKTNNFQLTSDDDFVVVYGVNHTKTGNAVYYNASIYGAKKLNGVSVIYSPDCEGSANEFFPKDCEESDNYYVYKMARKGCGNCVAVIPYSTGNPKGACYGVDNYQEVFVGFRSYVNQKTLVGPAPYNIIWDQAILFKKKRSCKH